MLIRIRKWSKDKTQTTLHERCAWKLAIYVFKKSFSDLNLYDAVMSSGLVVHLKLKYFLMKPTHDDIIEAKEVYNKLSFEKYRYREVHVAYLKSSNCHELLGILLPQVGYL